MKNMKNENGKTKRWKVFLLFTLSFLLLFSACSSNDHMYRHKRSDCDCPRFD